jgi:hypothetical protein
VQVLQVLFDQGTPAPLRQFLSSHQVATAYERGWSTLKNGELLQAAERAGFSVLVTTDTNLKYQQNLASRRISVVVLSTTSWPRIKAQVEPVVLAVNSAVPGSYAEVRIP